LVAGIAGEDQLPDQLAPSMITRTRSPKSEELKAIIKTDRLGVHGGMNDSLHLGSSAAIGDAATRRPETFESLVAAEHARLYSALCLITRDRFEAEDILQDALIKIWERWDRVGAMDDPTGYLYRTAMNLFRKRMRRTKLALRRTAKLAPGRDELADVESREVVVRALGTLTPRQRMSIVLTDLLGYPSEDAAKLMGIRSSTVRVLASQGRTALKKDVGETLDG
ncbi:MAG: SigE family RNA polymerase sigma factor, partial [Actinomycetota bacterium]